MSLTPKLMYVYFSHYVFFTFSNISKTLILCSIKQKPRTWCNKFTASSMRNTDNEGDRFGFCFDSDQCDQRFPSLTLLLLIRCKAKIHSLIWTVREFILSFPSKQSWSWIIWNDQHQGFADSSDLGLTLHHSGPMGNNERYTDKFLDNVMVKRDLQLKTTNPV